MKRKARPDVGGTRQKKLRNYGYDRNGNQVLQIIGKAKGRADHMRSNLPKHIYGKRDTTLNAYTDLYYNYNNHDDRIYKKQQNHNGNSTETYYLRDASGSDYFAFGKTLRSFNNSKYRFTGKEHDGETNLEYFGARKYDAEVARWTSIDPMREKYPSMSPYNYAANNPVFFIDPDGRDIFPHRTKQYLYASQAKEVFKHIENVRLSEYPKNIHELGVTGLHKDSNGKMFYYEPGKKAGTYDVHYNVYVAVSATLKDGYPMANKNPGLNKEVEAHEDSHGDQWETAFNSVITVKSGSFTFTGKIDNILGQAAKAYDNTKAKNSKSLGSLTKSQFLDIIFNGSIKEIDIVFQSAKPNVEADANNRAMIKTQNYMPYTNGQKVIMKPNGQPLK